MSERHIDPIKGPTPEQRHNYLLRGLIGPHEDLYIKDQEFHTFIQMWTNQMIALIDANAAMATRRYHHERSSEG